MELNNITFQGPPLDDQDILDSAPDSLVVLLNSLNGFIQFGGGLHVRGACSGPEWHSLRWAWHGPNSIGEIYPSVEREWVPFGEDCVGDQFLLRGEEVLHLSAETGDVAEMGVSLWEFLTQANADPVEFLQMAPLLRFREDHGDLPEGHLLLAYPPFCTSEADQGVSLKAVPAWDLHKFHGQLANALPEDGKKVRFEIGD